MFPHRNGYSLGAIGGAEFVEDVCDVFADPILRQSDGFGYVRVCHALHHGSENLCLALSQFGDWRILAQLTTDFWIDYFSPAASLRIASTRIGYCTVFNKAPDAPALSACAIPLDVP